MSSQNSYFEKDFYIESSDPNIKLRKLHANNHIYMYKSCYNPEYKQTYASCFKQEFDHMRHLKEIMRDEEYTHLFPNYYEYGFHDDRPYILMDYIEGQTLETCLSRYPAHISEKTKCHQYITNQKILYLFKQLNTAEYWLQKAGLLQLDLNPGNIIITDNNFHIKLIDFTDAFYLSDQIREQRLSLEHPRTYKLIEDARPNPDFQGFPSLQLREAAILLFTRLFYNGDSNYNYYHSDNDIFFDQYSTLLNSRRHPETINLLDVPNDDHLFYWNQWIEQLCRLLS